MQMQQTTTGSEPALPYGFMSRKQTKQTRDASDEELVESRFGPVRIRQEQAIFFPQGMLGLPQNLHFCITDVPREHMGQFRLLQCLSDHSLSFVVLPIGLENGLIEKSDLDECCTTLRVDPANLLVLLVVSVRRTPENTQITANLRAPIIVDVQDRMAIQYVFSHNKYDICQVISSHKKT